MALEATGHISSPPPPPASSAPFVPLPQQTPSPTRQDPARSPFFIINNSRPFNAEPPRQLLLDAGFITPNELYYVRNHLPVPTVDPETYRLHVEIQGKAGLCVQYSLDYLKTKFPHVRVLFCGALSREGRTFYIYNTVIHFFCFFRRRDW